MIRAITSFKPNCTSVNFSSRSSAAKRLAREAAESVTPPHSRDFSSLTDDEPDLRAVLEKIRKHTKNGRWVPSWRLKETGLGPNRGS